MFWYVGGFLFFLTIYSPKFFPLCFVRFSLFVISSSSCQKILTCVSAHHNNNNVFSDIYLIYIHMYEKKMICKKIYISKATLLLNIYIINLILLPGVSFYFRLVKSFNFHHSLLL